MLKKLKSFIIILIFLLSSVTTMVLGFNNDTLDRQMENEEFQNIEKKNYLINYIEDISNKINTNDKNNTGSFFKNNSDNITIFGFVKDNSSNLPIENAHVYILYQKFNETGENYSISAYTNQTGWYKLIIPRSDYIDLLKYTFVFARAQKYFWNEYTIDLTQNQDLFWANISLTKGRAPETSTIKGFITDEKTGDYLKEAFVICIWRDSQNNGDINITYSDQNGYYQMNVTNGLIVIYILHPNHLAFYSDEYWIYAWENRWLNFSLIPILEKNAIVNGHIYDSDTGDPIENVDVRLRWARENTVPNLYNNYTTSDSQGYFMTKTAEGNIYLRFDHDDYHYYQTPEFAIEDNGTVILNISLEPYLHIYNYKWTRKIGNYDFGDLFVDKRVPYMDSFLISNEQGSVLTSATIYVNWMDDNTYGLLFKKGEDILNVNISYDDTFIQENSIGSGNISYNFRINDLPADGFVLAINPEHANNLIKKSFLNLNNAFFYVIVDIDTGEKIWRVLQYLRDKGNTFDMNYEYVYYEYFIEEI